MQAAEYITKYLSSDKVPCQKRTIWPARATASPGMLKLPESAAFKSVGVRTVCAVVR